MYSTASSYVIDGRSVYNKPCSERSIATCCYPVLSPKCLDQV